MALVRDYELGIIVNPDVGDEQARAIVDRITQTISANDGQVVRVNAQGRRRLAYPVDRHRDGLYFYFDMTLPPQSVIELERRLRVNEDVVRHLLILRDPRAVAQQRQRDAEADAQAAALAATQAAQAAQSAQAPAEREPAEVPEETPVAAAEESEPASAEPAAELAAESDEDESDEDESDEHDGDVAETTAIEAEANA